METILLAVVAAMVYAIAGYLKSAGEDFNAVKFGATAIVGAFVGVSMFLSGLPITEASVMVQMGIYVGVVVMVENVLKAIVRKARGMK